MRVGRRLRTAVATLVAGLSWSAHGEPPAVIGVGIVAWPADPDDVMAAFVGEVETCIAARLAAVAPGIAVTRQRRVRDMLFPLLEPATQPRSEEAFAEVLARGDVRERLASHGLRYLVSFTGTTVTGEGRGYVACGAGMGGGGCLGFAWNSEHSRIDAALWRLDRGSLVQRDASGVEGTTLMPAFGLPVVIPARTMAGACRDIGDRIAASIRRNSAAPAPPP